MTPEQKRIAIAEAMPAGLIHYAGPATTPMLHVGGDKFIVFDPLNDLNAMHDAEETLLDRESQKAYIRALWALESRKKYNDHPQWAYWPMLHATATQRADAFLITIGKLKD